MVPRLCSRLVNEFDLLNAAASCPHIGCNAGCIGVKALLVLFEYLLQLSDRTLIYEMDMAHFSGADHFRLKAAPIEPEARSLGSRRDHRTLLNGHRQGEHLSIDLEIRCDPKGQIVIGDRILNEFVVQLLTFRFRMPIGLQKTNGRLWVFKMLVCQPLDLGLFAQLGKSFDLFRHRMIMCSINPNGGKLVRPWEKRQI